MLRSLASIVLFVAFAAGAAPDDPDSAWGDNGVVVLSEEGDAYSAAFDIDHALIAIVSGRVARFTSAGAIDTSFGDHGFAPLSCPDLCPAEALVRQPDGRIVAAVARRAGTGWQVAIVRWTADGRIDESFGTAGTLLLPASDSYERILGLRAGADGTLVVASSVAGADPRYPRLEQALLRRVSSAGLLLAETRVPTAHTELYNLVRIALQPDGRILAAAAGLSGLSRFAVMRYGPDGAPDPEFGSGGIAEVETGGIAFAQDVALLPDGRILAAGSRQVSGGPDDVVLLRLFADGRLDPTFGIAGIAAIRDPRGSSTSRPIIAVQPGGRVLVAAQVPLATTSAMPLDPEARPRILVARLDADGSADTRFAGAGISTLWTHWGTWLFGIASRDDGRILVVGAGLAAADFVEVDIGGGLIQRNVVPHWRPVLALLRGGETISDHPLHEARAFEYVHESYGHYFVTAMPEEAIDLAMTSGSPWTPTGKTYKVWVDRPAGGDPVCRFWSGQSFAPLSSHFYTPYPGECSGLQSSPVWVFEGTVFDLLLPGSSDGACARDSQPLFRAYNNGISGAPNHRYTTDRALLDAMVDQGWTMEGHGSTSAFACVPLQE